jgi:hypothetical protein
MEMDTTTRTQPAAHTRSPAELKEVILAERAGLPFLVWRDGSGVQRIFVLQERRRHTVGRRAANDVVLSEDPEVSRVHAELEPLAEDWAVADQGLSRNGTFMGEDPILGRRRLVDGDVLRFGRTPVEYRRPAAGSTVRTATAPASVGTLTERQRQILVALARPYKPGVPSAGPASNAAIAREVHLGLDAVKGHLGVLYRRFDIAHLPRSEKRARLVECALRWGLVSERDL